MKLIYYFVGGRLSRLKSQDDYPKEMFYGADVQDDTVILEYEQDATHLHYLEKIAIKLIGKVSNGVISFLEFKRVSSIGVEYDILLSTSLPLSLATCIRSRLMGDKKQAIYFNMLTNQYHFSFIDKLLIKFAKKNLLIISISGKEYDLMNLKLPNVPHRLIEFGVDTNFWNSSKPPVVTQKDYYFSVGQDKHRDWKTLITSFSNINLDLVIINNIKSHGTLPNNITHIYGNFYQNNDLSDEKLRDLYSGAKGVIVPLANCNKPSGQSVCLQAMAMKIPVVLTKTDGIWSNRLKDKINCFFVDEGAPQSIENVVKFIENNPRKVKEIVESAYELVMEYYTYSKFTQSLFNTIRHYATPASH